MFCIWLESIIVVLGSIVMYSLSCQPSDDDTDRGVHIQRWNYVFGPVQAVMFFLTFLGFYNFIELSSRIVKIKFHFCDDDITDVCMVGETSWWYFWSLVVMPSLSLLLFALHGFVTYANKHNGGKGLITWGPDHTSNDDTFEEDE